MNSDESNESNEDLNPSTPPSPVSAVMTLDKAIELGEYDPDYLATFPEWHTFTKHVQWEFINRALNNRNKQILQQYAAINNILDFSKKPEAQAALKGVEEQMKKFREDREKLLIEYSKP